MLPHLKTSEKDPAWISVKTLSRRAVLLPAAVTCRPGRGHRRLTQLGRIGRETTGTIHHFP